MTRPGTQQRRCSLNRVCARRQRDELEYPSGPGETTTPEEADKAIADAGRIHSAAQQLLATLPIF
jgi:hypothetical protein